MVTVFPYVPLSVKVGFSKVDVDTPWFILYGSSYVPVPDNVIFEFRNTVGKANDAFPALPNSISPPIPVWYT